MKFWSRAARILLATLIATQGAALLPAMAASASQSKRLAVKAIGEAELKSEYGAGGGGGGTTDPPVSDPVEVVAQQVYITDAYLTSEVTYADSWVSGYSSESSCSSLTARSTFCDYTFTETTGSTYIVSGGFSSTVSINGGVAVKVFSVNGSAQGGYEVNGSYTANSSTSISKTTRYEAPGYTTLYYRAKYRTQRNGVTYSVKVAYSNGTSGFLLQNAATLYTNTMSTITQSRKCDRLTGWCSEYF